MAPNQQPCPQTDLALIDILSNRAFRTEMEPESAWNTDVYLRAAEGGRRRASVRLSDTGTVAIFPMEPQRPSVDKRRMTASA